MRSGAVLILAGVWLVARTVTHDDSGRNLVDRILGDGSSSDPGLTPAELRHGRRVRSGKARQGTPFDLFPGSLARARRGAHLPANFGHPVGP